ncbi:hypothetical protein EAJ09_01710 [Bacteroides stercoris]|nr:hypothetical protein EAJ09_01710 [Bacteroides stercoris]
MNSTHKKEKNNPGRRLKLPISGNPRPCASQDGYFRSAMRATACVQAGGEGGIEQTLRSGCLLSSE